MYAKMRTNLTGLAAALSFVVVGFSLGEAPSAAQRTAVTAAALAQAEAEPSLEVQAPAAPAKGRGALRRHLAMPYVSFPALLPRRES